MTAYSLFTIFWTFIGAFFLFSITVLAHEWGHFLAARWQGLVVERFAIGFGPPMFTWRSNGVEYCLNWFPFGGYVLLPQMAAMDMVEGEAKSDIAQLPYASPKAKIITAFAGPLFSFLFAIVLACVAYYVGVPQNQYVMTTTIGYVEPGSPADLAGVKAGDRILAVDDHKVTRWQGRSNALVESIIFSVGTKIKIDVERGPELHTFEITPEKKTDREGLRWLGLEDAPAAPLVIDSVIPESSAAHAGLKTNDEIVALNDIPMLSVVHASHIFKDSTAPVATRVKRGGEELTVSLLASQVPGRPEPKMVGIAWKKNVSKLVFIPPMEQIKDAATMVFRTLRALLTPGSGVGIQHLSGPVGIFDKIMFLLTVDLRLVLFFTVLLNVNLAIVNLVPMPVLDGGHIAVAGSEAIFRRPMQPKTMYPIQMGGAIVLIGLFLVVTFYDLRRIGERWSDKDVKVSAPAKSPEPPANK